jgi:hypothetical protein
MEKQDTSHNPPKLELYYRAPLRTDHVLLNEALDELYKKIAVLEKKVDELSRKSTTD